MPERIEMHGCVGLPYEVRLIGGPYDGAPDVWWVTIEGEDDGLPSTLLIMRCPGRGECGARNCPWEHVVAWDADEADCPSLPSVPYARAEVREDEQVAVYVYALIDARALPAWTSERQQLVAHVQPDGTIWPPLPPLRQGDSVTIVETLTLYP